MRSADGKKIGSTFLLSVIACVAFCMVAGGIGHLFSATYVPDFYVMAIGANMLPIWPLESMTFGPIYLGVYVSWWFGLAASPLVYLIARGPSGAWRVGRVIRAGAVGMVASVGALLIASSFGGAWRDGFALAVLQAEFDSGYALLGIGLIVMGLLIRTAERNI